AARRARVRRGDDLAPGTRLPADNEVARRGSTALTDAGRESTDRPRLWPVFLSCLAAFVTNVAFSLLAAAIVRSLYPDLSERAVFGRLAGLLAVIIVGVVAGTAEEMFFRGYMQTRLVQRLPRVAAVGITAFCFGVFHLDWLHGLLALALGLYLGWITELTGSALPAVVCHVIN